MRERVVRLEQAVTKRRRTGIAPTLQQVINDPQALPVSRDISAAPTELFRKLKPIDHQMEGAT